MKALFIGGTGTISSEISALCVRQGWQLTLLNRGNARERVPAGAETVTCDICDEKQVLAALGDRTFDVVADFIAFTPEHVERDIRLFKGRCAQYIFISSASAYMKPLPSPVVTESTPLIAAFGEAVREADVAENATAIRALNTYATEQLRQIEGVAVNSTDAALPYIINLSVEGIRSETMLHHLEQNGVYVSSSSACAKGKRSYVLAAMGLPDSRIDSSIRVSFSKYNTKEDVDALIAGLKNGIETLQKVRRQ